VVRRQRYQELDDRQQMLRLLRDKIWEARNAGESGLDLKISEGGAQVGIGYRGSPGYNDVGDELGMSGPDKVALFERIRDRYLIGRLHNPKPMIPFYLAELRNSSDDGLKMLDLLPQEQLIVALREVKAAAEAPDTPGDERDKREVVEWANKGITLAKNLERIADKVKDVL